MSTLCWQYNITISVKVMKVADQKAIVIKLPPSNQKKLSKVTRVKLRFLVEVGVVPRY